MSLRALSVGGRVGIAAAVALACAAAIVLAAGHDRDRPAARSTDSWAALRPSDLERTEVGAARVGDRIYVVGGFISSGGTTGKMERYDISADRWRRRAQPADRGQPPRGHGARRPGLRARRQPRRRRRPRAQVAPPLPLQPAPRSLDAAARRAERRARRSAWSRSATSSTPPAATTRATRGCARSRSTTPSAAAGPAARRCRPAATTSGAAVLDGDLVVTGGRPGDVNGGMTTVERYDPQAQALVVAAAAGRPPAAATRRSSARGRLVVFGGEELGPGRADDRAGRGLRPRHARPGARCRRWSPRATGSAASPAAGASTRSRAGPQPGLAYSRALEYLDLP